jgi:hypothetical protein
MMRGDAFVQATPPQRARGRRLLLPLLAAVVLAGGPAFAQSFLGTFRGTVTDPQGAAVDKAVVVITDEATGVSRSVQTDAQGRYEASNMRPGMYRVEVVTDSFKKYERTGVLLRAAAIALVDVTLDLGARTETVTVSGEAINNITLESPSISRGFDEQQLKDLPRNSRDVQSFLTLNPNVVGGFDDIQFLGSRTYGVSYIQDGQASTNAVFGSVGNSAPGLDAVSEIQVLSNSYNAEYGGLAGVVVTTKRGGNTYHGTAFYDYNADGLNALPYNVKLAGVERGDPTGDTHEHRWGASFGGPLKSDRTFFHMAYEGSNDKAIYGGGRANVPTEAMRNGDFSATTITPRDPVTGLPFPGKVIPAGRISPEARSILDMFYPLPNQGTLASGMGIYQQFMPASRNRQRADLRLDHDMKNDSFFLRGSYQRRDPQTVTFETGNALTNNGIQDRVLTTYSVVGGWTRIFSSSIVNEFRGGYNYDNSRRQSTYNVQQVNGALGLENAPSVGPDRVGIPRFEFQGGSATARPTNINDGGFNADRTLRQNAFSLSDNITWVMGGHAFKAGGLWNRNTAIDGRGRGVDVRGRYRFNGSKTGNAFSDFLLGLPINVGDRITNRGPLEGHSDDFAVFAQDDWKVHRDLTVFLGLRYEIVGSWHEKSGILGSFQPFDGGHHVVPSQQVAALLPPGVIDLGRTQIASDVGIPDTLVNTDKNNFSPRVGFSWRFGGSDKTVLRGGFGLFHPTAAVQGVRDLLASNMFRYFNIRTGNVTLKNGFTTGTGGIDPADFGNQGIDPDLQLPDIYQYNLTLEREIPGSIGIRVSYIGSTSRKLLVDRDYNTAPASTNTIILPDDLDKMPFPQYGTFMDYVQNTGSGHFNAGQIELLRRFRNGLAFNVAYTYSKSDSNAPDVGDSSLGVVQFDPYDIEKDRGPDPNVVTHRVVANATWDIPVGRGRKHGANMPGWANALFGGWTVSTLFQARSGNHLTPFFTSFYTTTPWNTGKPLDGLGNFFCCAWRPDQISDPNVGGTRDAFFNQAAYALPAPGQLGNAKKGSLLGPGTWVVNFAFYKDIVQGPRFKLQLTALLDNAFNHPQFFPGYGTGFAQLDSFLVDGDPNNGSTAVLGSDAIDNIEGFAVGRVFRIGLRATF